MPVVIIYISPTPTREEAQTAPNMDVPTHYRIVWQLYEHVFSYTHACVYAYSRGFIFLAVNQSRALERQGLSVYQTIWCLCGCLFTTMHAYSLFQPCCKLPLTPLKPYSTNTSSHYTSLYSHHNLCMFLCILNFLQYCAHIHAHLNTTDS
jgi:hypothetical protein